MAHLDLLPDEMGVGTVAFKAGTEWTVLNRLLNLSARIRRRWGWPRWERLTAPVRALSWLMGRFGKDEGGVIFALTGRSQGRELTHRLAINARRDGGLIPAILASIAASRLISGNLQASGLVPLNNWLTTAELLDELRGRGLAWRMLDHLVSEAKADGITRLSLETGSQDAFTPARRLYEAAGFAPCPPFADYRDDPMSVYMTRSLA